MKAIYNELRRYNGKLTEFARVLVDKGLYQDTKNCIATMRHAAKDRPDIKAIFDEWKHGKLKTKDIEKYNEKLREAFNNLKGKA